MAHDKVSLVGHTKSYHQILIKGDPDELLGKRVKVKVTGTTKHSMLGKVISPPQIVATSPNRQVIREKSAKALNRQATQGGDWRRHLAVAIPAVLIGSYLVYRKKS